MTIDVDAPVRREFKHFAYDQFRIYSELGAFGLRVYTPSTRLIDERGMEPGVSVAYGNGWAQGVDAVNDIGERLARDGHMRFAALKLPLGDHEVADMVPFRTEMLRSVSDVLFEEYPDDPQVIMGYSRGSSPAAIVAGERSDRIAGVSFVAPTWFSGEHTSFSLALRAAEEGAGAILRDSPRDRLDLVKLAYHALREAARRPSELKRDVAAIARESRPADLINHLNGVARVGVVIGDHDGLCRAEEIAAVAREIEESNPDRDVDVRRVRSDHFHVFTNTQSRAEIIDQVKKIAA